MKQLNNTYVLILAGGIGSRFWPVSRASMPKQFLDILGRGKTLIQDAFDRYAKVIPEENIYIITNESYLDLVKEQLPAVSDNQILGEPIGRNTAACIAYAAHKLFELNEDAVLVVAPSDHLIVDEDDFIHQLERAHKFASEHDALITLGIKPHRPDTGYGYIQFDQHETEPGVNKVVTFTEKPPLEMAEKFLESGDFLWNSGMFVWSLHSILNALNEYLPEMNLAFSEGKGAYNTSIEQEHVDRIYTQINSISIDNGVLEKAENVYVLPSQFGWSDLGTWKSVLEHVDQGNDNVTLNATLEAYDAKDNLVVTQGDKLVVIKDLKGYFVIDTDDVLLICRSDQEQEVKKIASDVKKKHKRFV